MQPYTIPLMTYRYKILPIPHVPIEHASAITDSSPNPEDLAIQTDNQEHVLAVLRKLLTPRAYSIVFCLYFRDMSTASTASMFGLSESAVKKIRRQALAVLRKSDIRGLLTD